MANYTENYNLEKPLQEEYYNVDVFNGNADILDAELKGLHDDVAALQGGTGLSDHINNAEVHFTSGEKAAMYADNLNFKRKLRMGGMI